MKMLLYIALLLLICFLPVQGTDVGELIPVEVVAIAESDGVTTICTDTGNQGQGRTLGEAFVDLERAASGVIYLDTAEFILIQPGGEAWLEMLPHYLRGDTKVCAAEADIELKGIADYLSVHHPGIHLEEAEEAGVLPVLSGESGRYQIK